MQMKKENFIKILMEKTGKSEIECRGINDILEDHFIIGHNNKDKIKADFMEKLGMTEEEADDLYNICSESIVAGIFRKEN